MEALNRKALGSGKRGLERLDLYLYKMMLKSFQQQLILTENNEWSILRGIQE
jgi:hypothetical protein